MSALLEIRGLTAHYGDFQALFGVDLALERGEVMAIIGANGAGKTTLMRAITGIARVSGGSVALAGRRLDRLAAPDILRAGVSMVPEGRRLFPSLTVEENLLIGAHARRGSGFWTLARLYDLFPILRERRQQPATALSGGQQQMVAIGRALMSNPDVLLCDELSLGLAPVVIREIYAAFPTIRDSGTAITVVEQDIGQALKIADHVHCMMEGRITLSGRPDTLSRDAIHNAYFGVHA
ncbi:ATP-binding cassette domain-containing protein [Paracoccus limosus]|jgi:branched-chain amino acid transport system ATP-binding protein|uniref:ATP-binding cassette domain-containing protein n=1 Tax=Paracoccus limosus TaxID=913252 RepID=A0A844GYH1_9RHOB|nr:ABC transporter ATP-binding protein [Paracoccus limosus]MTH33679.1 ATP-binding cassette domain-containing protein [Paracoccus limosus]